MRPVSPEHVRPCGKQPRDRLTSVPHPPEHGFAVLIPVCNRAEQAIGLLAAPCAKKNFVLRNSAPQMRRICDIFPLHLCAHPPGGLFCRINTSPQSSRTSNWSARRAGAGCAAAFSFLPRVQKSAGRGFTSRTNLSIPM